MIPPSFVCQETLSEVARVFDLPVDEVFRRFRPNVLLSEGSVLEEETLVGKCFTLGSAVLKATHVCRRCGVPTRNSRDAQKTKNFVEEFMAWRKEQKALPVGSEDGLYRLCVRTQFEETLEGEIPILHSGNHIEVID